METRTCQNCKQEFRIEPEDFLFYEKMAVPAPTFCPRCRFQRRTMFRNERVLYRRQCGMCKKDMISIYAPDSPYMVYCGPCWWSDGWDPLASGRAYDPARPFFTQFKELMQRQPQVNLVVDFPTLQNSEYTNHTGHLKNCYLLFDADYCENVYYSTTINTTKDTMDCHLVWESELCYENVNCTRTFKTFFSEDCTDCHEVYFSKNLIGCNNCFGCINLKNKSYHIFNKPCAKEDYDKKLSEFATHSFEGLGEIREQARTFHLERMNENVSGDYIYESKNTHYVFSVRGIEDAKYCVRLNVAPTKDAYDYFEWGHNARRIYECITVGEETSDVRFTFFGLKSMDAAYCMSVVSAAHLFGCVGLRNKKYCILNQQYSKDEFENLRQHIISDMTDRPYEDKLGRTWRYGEFFPYDLCPFGYNETTAAQYVPLTKEQALA